MTFWTNGHFYSPFTAWAADYSCEQVDVLLSGEAVSLYQELAAHPPSVAQAGSITVRRFKVPHLRHGHPPRISSGQKVRCP